MRTPDVLKLEDYELQNEFISSTNEAISAVLRFHCLSLEGRQLTLHRQLLAKVWNDSACPAPLEVAVLNLIVSMMQSESLGKRHSVQAYLG